MIIYALTNSGLESLAAQEIQELLNKNSTISNRIVTFEGSKEDALTLAIHGQAIRRVAIGLGTFSSLDNISLDLTNLLTSDLTFKCEVENVKGNENRLAIAKKVGKAVFGSVPNTQFDVKNPDIIILVHHSGEEYHIGVALTTETLNDRDYRVFTHPASFKGDLGYFFVRQAGPQPGKLVYGFLKDGTVPIEASLYLNRLPINEIESKVPLMQNVQPLKLQTHEHLIDAFDEGTQNTTAARKNIKLAGAKVDVHKYKLEDLDAKYDKESVDHLFFQLTHKDEDRINEVYYQASFILKPQGTFAILGRPTWDLSISTKFTLLKETTISKGDSQYKIWVLHKKAMSGKE